MKKNPTLILIISAFLVINSVNRIASQGKLPQYAECEILILCLGVQDLLRLDETIGEVKHRGLQLTDVQHLPSYEVQESASSTAHDTSVQVCVICLDDFIARQMIRALPCCHEFHAKCIDRWLIVRRPTCITVSTLYTGSSSSRAVTHLDVGMESSVTMNILILYKWQA